MNNILLMGGRRKPWYLGGGIQKSDCVAAYQAIGARNIGDSFVNLANPGTYNLINGVAPDWSADDGWTFDGAKYMETGITISNQAWSVFVRFSDIQSSLGSKTHTVIGCFNVAGFYIQPVQADFGSIFNNGASYAGSIYRNGVMGISGKNAIYNGSFVGSIPAGGIYPNTLSMHIGKLNRLTGDMHWLYGKIQAIAIYSRTLTNYEYITVSNRMAALP